MWMRPWSDFPELSELSRLRREMDRMLGHPNGQTFEAAGYPPLNLWENDDNLFVETEVPGMELDELEIFVNGDLQLTIQGERKAPTDVKGTWHRRERSYGKFARMIQLPTDVHAEGVVAEYADGVLRLTLPKKEEAKPRRIEVKFVG